MHFFQVHPMLPWHLLQLLACVDAFALHTLQQRAEAESFKAWDEKSSEAILLNFATSQARLALVLGIFWPGKFPPALYNVVKYQRKTGFS